MKEFIYKMLTASIRPFYGSGIWQYFPFNYIYKFYVWVWHRIFYWNTNEILKETSFGFQIYLEKWKFIDTDIMNFGIWEPHISHLISTHLKKGDTFLDLWANIGYFSLLAAQIVDNEWKVIAFEPSKNIFAKLTKNISVNNFKNIVTHNLWVGIESSKQKLYYNDNNPWGSSIINTDGEIHTMEDIEIIKLDDFLGTQKIDFIKMDIEGFEYFAIQWMLDLLAKNNNIKMIFEYSPQFYQTLYGDNFTVESIWLLDQLKKLWFYLYEIHGESCSSIEDTRAFFEKVFSSQGGQMDIFCTKTILL